MIELAQNIASYIVIESAIESGLLWLLALAFLRLFRVSSPNVRQVVFALPLVLPVALVTVFHVLDVVVPFPVDRPGPVESFISKWLVLPLPLVVVFSLAGVVGIAASLAVLVRQGLVWSGARGTWRRQRRDNSPLRYRCSAILDVLATRLGCRAPKLVLTDRGSAGSLALGWWSYIFVPRALAVRLDDEELEALLAHEIGHVVRRDGLLDCLAKVCRNLMLFNPLAHLALSRFELERELATDDLTARSGGNRLALASCLLKGYRFRARHAWVPVTRLLGGTSALESRVQRLMRDVAPLPPSTGVWLTVALFVAGVSAAFVVIL
ncbi:MAG: M56 family metallopeptidase [Chloroflexi bacterium]|nr:M56 family metallopeptidase [Chloroflexota bacterium]